ncbi:hypothetical protein [Silvimonas amylolytica]|uniref:PEP-CTERM protein-sorting domain-containing protein n=1 Tax=Silvimonas amylolytica TaxID=449663 RepID=A0ABQ2PHP5_9NEIS|nr:hypothetical protein [Silvimonas amylolytica]GGP24835.1 hypothetical protein GCM10010971_06540 [Silvimonas amylolytica]
MRLLAALGIVLGFIFSTANASAKYEYSYTFADPAPNADSPRSVVGTAYTVYGTFLGTANGDLITNLSDVFLSVKDNNGNVLIDKEPIFPYAGPSFGLIPDVLSFSGHHNQFIFDWDDSLGGPAPVHGYAFTSYGNEATDDAYGQGVDVFSLFGAGGFHVSDQIAEPSSWKVTEVSPVPEPETYVLTMMGLVALYPTYRKKSHNRRASIRDRAAGVV